MDFQLILSSEEVPIQKRDKGLIDTSFSSPLLPQPPPPLPVMFDGSSVM